MRFQPCARRIFLVPALMAGFGLFIGGCGSSPTTPKPGSSPSGKSSSPSSTSSAAESAIKANWAAFFAGSTPVSRRVALLENGTQFQSLISKQAGSGLAQSASAKVTAISDITSSTAGVTYSIYLAGAVALPNQKGEAVYQDGTWKVGDQSFCALLVLENGKKTGVPTACQSAT
jgi:hypothetical protein